MTLEHFASQLEARNQIHINRKTDACCWFFKDQNLFHNRTFWGRGSDTSKFGKITPAKLFHGLNSSIEDRFWAGSFTDLKLAEEAAAKYGGVTELEFYCSEESPTWFLIFNDWNKVVKFVYDERKFVEND